MRLCRIPFFMKSGVIMPAAVTHFFHAQRALGEFQKQSEAPVLRDAFLLGAQGPDFLFFDHRIPWRKGVNLQNVGERMHREPPTRLLKALQIYVRGLPEADPARSYVYGFLCHYSLDRTAHPYVYACVGKLAKEYPGRSESFLHCMLESALDVILLRYERQILPTEFDLRQTVPMNPIAWESVADLYSVLIRELYGMAVEKQRLLQNLKDWRLLVGWENDRTTLKKTFLDAWEKRSKHYRYSCFLRGVSEDGDFDYANVTGSEWRWPEKSGGLRTESFFDLYQASIRESVKFMLDFFNTDNSSAMTEEIPFS